MFPTVELTETNCMIIFTATLNLFALWLPIATIRVCNSEDARARAIVEQRESGFQYGSGISTVAYFASCASAIVYLLNLLIYSVISIGGIVALVVQTILDVWSSSVLRRVNANKDEFDHIKSGRWLAIVEFILRVCIAADVISTIFSMK